MIPKRVIPSWFLPLLSAQPENIPVVSPRAAPQQASAGQRVSPTEEPVAHKNPKEFGYNNKSHPLLRDTPPLPFALTRDFDMNIQ